MNGHALLLQSVAQHCRPRQRLTVSQWADAHRKLSSKSSPEAGSWRTARTPFLREIMDSLSLHSPVKKVVVMKGSQIGVTEVGLNFIGYVIDHAPAPMLVVVPTLEVRDRWILQRLHPMLRETPTLSRHFDSKRSRDASNSKDVKDFPGGILVLSGANSPSSLRSMPIRYVVVDELDAFPWDVKGEGDPLGLIRARQANFPRRKELIISTPTIKDSSRIEEEFLLSDQRYYQVPCPHCDEGLVLRWANLQWDKACNHVVYVCEHCGSEIEEHSKPRMLAAGEWIPKNPGAEARGYHINGLYSPIGLGYSWFELAKQWKVQHKETSTLKRFINTVLGETYGDKSRRVKTSLLQQRAEPYALRTVPAGCLLATAGVDTQDNRLAVQILGWGRGETCWILDWLELPGSPSRLGVWKALLEILNTPLHGADGITLKIQATALDTGGHHTHDVYQFVRSGGARRLMAIKGANTPNKPVLAGRPTAQDINWRGQYIKKGVHLWAVGTDTAKHVLFGRLHADADLPPPERKIHFSDHLEEDFYRQLTSEVFDPEKNRFIPRRGMNNEGLDTWVYGYAAAMHPEIRINTMRDQDWDRLQQQLLPHRTTEPKAHHAQDQKQPPGTPGNSVRDIRKRAKNLHTRSRIP